MLGAVCGLSIAHKRLQTKLQIKLLLVCYRPLALICASTQQSIVPFTHIRHCGDSATRVVLRLSAAHATLIQALWLVASLVSGGNDAHSCSSDAGKSPQPQRMRTLSRLRSAAKDALEQHTERVQTGAGPGAPSPERAAHNKRQQEVFDSAAEFFASPEASPPEVEATLDALAARICAPSRPDAAFRVLDVGSGTGCLSRRYDNAAGRRICHRRGPVAGDGQGRAQGRQPNIRRG